MVPIYQKQQIPGDEIREDEIRPDNLMEEQAKCFANDIRRIQERIGAFVEVSCPACGATEYTKRFEKYKFSYVDCLKCETMYVNPRPTSEILEMYYSTSENYAFWNKYIFPASEETRRQKIFRPRAERIKEICERYGVDRDVLLEVGAGFGTFCQEVNDFGLFKRVIAVEPTPDLAKACKTRGIETIDQPVERTKLAVAVDVVVSFEVIEHLYDPKVFIQYCRDVIKPGGLIVLTCPNVKGFDILLLQDKSNSVDIEHLNYFHPKSLSGLLESCGFNVLEVFTPGKLDAELVRKKVQAGEFDISGMPFLKRILIEEWDRLGGNFQSFLADNGLSSHMWIVAQKKK